jgi:hypothetical protein
VGLLVGLPPKIAPAAREGYRMGLIKRPGSDYWYIEFIHNGRRYKTSAGTSNKAAARAIEATMRAELVSGSEQALCKSAQAARDVMADPIFLTTGTNIISLLAIGRTGRSRGGIEWFAKSATDSKMLLNF